MFVATATKTLNAIVADDNDTVAKVLGLLVKRLGLEPRRAKTGEEALALAKAKTPDLMLLEVMLPGMDGYAVLTRLRGETWGRDLPVVIVTGEEGTVQDEIAEALGAGRVVHKPFDLEALAARLRGMLPEPANDSDSAAAEPSVAAEDSEA